MEDLSRRETHAYLGFVRVAFSIVVEGNMLSGTGHAQAFDPDGTQVAEAFPALLATRITLSHVSFLSCHLQSRWQDFGRTIMQDIISPEEEHSCTHLVASLVHAKPVNEPVEEASLNKTHIGHLLALARLHDPHNPLKLVSHATSYTAQEKQRLLPGGIHVQKSVTLRFGAYSLLVSGIGDFHLAAEDYALLARVLRLSHADARRREINPPWFPAQAASGLARGVVSPFFPPDCTPRYFAIVLKGMLLKGQERAVHTGELVAVSLTLSCSLLVRVSSLRALVVDYNERFHPHIPVIDLPIRVSSDVL